MVRNACRIVPLEAFQIAAEWLQYQVASPIDTGVATCKCFSSVLAHQDIRVSLMTFYKYALVLRWGGFFCTYMVDVFNSIRKLCNLCFIYMLMVINVYVQRMNYLNFSFCTSPAKGGEGLCSLLSPSVVQWDAVTVFMECTFAQISKSLEEEVTGAVPSNRTTLRRKVIIM